MLLKGLKAAFEGISTGDGSATVNSKGFMISTDEGVGGAGVGRSGAGLGARGGTGDGGVVGGRAGDGGCGRETRPAVQFIAGSMALTSALKKQQGPWAVQFPNFAGAYVVKTQPSQPVEVVQQACWHSAGDAAASCPRTSPLSSGK